MEDEEHIRTICHISFAEYKGIMEIDIEERMEAKLIDTAERDEKSIKKTTKKTAKKAKKTAKKKKKK